MEERSKPMPFGPEAWGPLARGLLAYHRGDSGAWLTVHADDGEAEAMPLSVFFRREGKELRGADRIALELARGRTLDGGAGVGAVALLLQERGVDVTAVEVIPEAVAIMKERGVRNAVDGRLEELPADHSYDSVLLLMNGSALAGTLAGLPHLLGILEGLLAPGGQVLLDSTDLVGAEGAGLAWGRSAPGSRGGEAEPDVAQYPGELQYQVEFEGEKGAPFPQLFVDPQTLARVATGEGWRVDVPWRGEGGEYLARLTRGDLPGDGGGSP